MQDLSGTLTHRDLAREIGVSETTIKSYRRKFPGFIKLASRGKPLRFEAGALAVCRRIHEFFSRGLSVAEVAGRLGGEFERDSPAPERGEGGPARVAAAPDNSFSELSGTLRELARGLEASLKVQEAMGSRISRLEGLVGDLVGLENRTHSLQAELLARLDTISERAPAGAGRAEPVRAERLRARAAPEETDPAALLRLPVVIHSEASAFLGLTMRSGEPFLLSDFLAYLKGRAARQGMAESGWRKDNGGYVLEISGARGREEFRFEATQTPKGNRVAHFERMVVDGVRAADEELRQLFRESKSSLE